MKRDYVTTETYTKRGNALLSRSIIKIKEAIKMGIIRNC